MDRYKVWYFIKFNAVERAREQENAMLRKQAAEFRKRTGEERLLIRVLHWLMSLRATLQPSGAVLAEPADHGEALAYPVECDEYPPIDWQQVPEQAGE